MDVGLNAMILLISELTYLACALVPTDTVLLIELGTLMVNLRFERSCDRVLPIRCVNTMFVLIASA